MMLSKQSSFLWVPLVLLLVTHTNAAFMDKCIKTLMADGDGLLSSTDFANFVATIKDDGKVLQFKDLPFKLQLSFVWTVCHDPDTRQECIAGLQGDAEYGYTLTGETKEDLKGLCVDLAEFFGEDPTSPTTPAPVTKTKSPATPIPTTVVPSKSPITSSPTFSPSAATVTHAPVTGAPTTSAPRTLTPVSPAPVTRAPITQAPMTPAPIATAPITAAPITAAPISPAPISPAPITPAPITPAPISPAPITPANITPAPITASPDTPLTIGGKASGVESTPSSVGSSSISSDDTLSAGAWAGIAAAGAFLVVAGFVFARRQKESQNMSKGVPSVLGDESIFTEDNQFVAGAGYNLSTLKGSIVLSSSSNHSSNRGSQSETSSHKDVKDELQTTKGVAQFDPTTAAAIALYRRDDGEKSSVSSSSSSYHTPRRDSPLTLPPGVDAETYKRRKMDDLSVAIQAADWNAVYRIASSIAGSEELSSMSGVSNSNRGSALAMPGDDDIESQQTQQTDEHDAVTLMLGSPSSRVNQKSAANEDERAAIMDILLERGDWTGVANTAAGYAEADGTPISQKKRSILGIIKGRRTSTAADAMMSSASSIDSSFVESASGRVGAVPMESREYDFVAILGQSRSGTDDTASESSGESPNKRGSKTTQSTPTQGTPTIYYGDGSSLSDPASNEGFNQPPLTRGALAAGMAPAPVFTTDITSLSLAVSAVAATAAIAPASLHRSQSERVIPGQTKEKIKRKWPRRLFGRAKSTGHVLLDDSSSSSESPVDRPPIFKSMPVDSMEEEHPLGISSGSYGSAPRNRKDSSFSGSKDGSHVSFLSLRTDLDRAVACGDWAAVEALATQVEAIDPNPTKLYDLGDDIAVQPLGAMSRSAAAISPSLSDTDTSIHSLRAQLDLAVDQGDWALVEQLANQILALSPIKRAPNHHSDSSKYMILSEVQVTGTGSPIADRGEIVRVPRSPSSYQGSLSSHSTVDQNKVFKIGKMVNMRNWRGVSALAGVYDLEESYLVSSPQQNSRAIASSISEGSDPAVRGFANDWIAMGNFDNVGNQDNAIAATERAAREAAIVPGGERFSISAMMALQPRSVSPDPSFSSMSTENHTLNEFERLVGEGDWHGVVEAATREEFLVASDLADVGRQFETSDRTGDNYL